MPRRTIALAFIGVGVPLAVVSYFFLSAPLGTDSSNPRLQFAPALFVLGVILALLSAVVYELLPDRGEDSNDDGRES